MNNNTDMHANYIKYDSNGKELGLEKSPAIASIADEWYSELPSFELIPAGLILICVADNTNEKKAKFEGEVAIICDTKTRWKQVKEGILKGIDTRPMRFFLVKREWVRKMAARPLESE